MTIKFYEFNNAEQQTTSNYKILNIIDFFIILKVHI